jgi:hypothetical protein
LKIPKGGNQNSLVEEEQTTQWLKEKVQMDKQRSTKHIHKTKDQVRFNSRNKTMIKLLSSHNFARLTRWVPLVEQELLTLPEHLSSPSVFSRVTRSSMIKADGKL